MPERYPRQETSVKQQYALRAGGSGDCKISSSEITFGKVIGEGGKSTVHEGLLKRGTESIPVALKKYRVSRMSSRCKKQVESETENLSKLQHPNVVKYYGTCLDQKTIVMEQMGMTLNNDIECKVNNVRELLDECVDEVIERSLTNGRGSWVVGKSRGSWVWVVGVGVGRVKKIMKTNNNEIIIIIIMK